MDNNKKEILMQILGGLIFLIFLSVGFYYGIGRELEIRDENLTKDFAECDKRNFDSEYCKYLLNNLGDFENE